MEFQTPDEMYMMTKVHLQIDGELKTDSVVKYGYLICVTLHTFQTLGCFKNENGSLGRTNVCCSYAPTMQSQAQHSFSDFY